MVVESDIPADLTIAEYRAARRTPPRRRRAPPALALARAPMEDPMRVTRGVAVPLSEIELRVSRSSGPGGQHANVTASRVEAVLDVAALALAQRGAAPAGDGPGRARG